MRALLNRRLVSIIAATLLLGTAGCGSSNNDQGTAFTLLGFFSDADNAGECDDLGAGLLGMSLSLGVATGESPGTTGWAIIAAGLSNNLAGQGIRSESIHLTYEIPGSSVQPPPTVQPLTGFMGPFVGDDEEDRLDTSLPPGLEQQGSCQVSEFPVIPNAIREWINFNRSSLPETPFTMLVTAYVSGVTTAGDRLHTNEAVFFVEFTSDNDILPTGTTAPDAAQGADVLEPVE